MKTSGRWSNRLGYAARALLFLLACRTVVLVLQTFVRPVAPRGEVPALAVYTGLTLVVAVLSGIVLLRALDERPAAALGFALSRAVPRELGIGLAAGVLPHIVLALVLLLTGLLHYGSQSGSALGWLGNVGGALLVFAVAAAAEEAVYRGYGFQALVRGFGRWPALLLTSLLFALAHAGNPAVTRVALLNIFLAGVVLGLLYLRTLSLWLVTAAHAGWNWAMASLLDLPVSGLTLFDTPLYEPAVSGPRWLAGGNFGPEGGLLGTVGLLLVLLIVSRWPGVGPSAAQLAARPLPLQETEEKSNE